MVEVTDARGYVTKNDYDALNRLTSSTQDFGGLNITVSNEYDEVGNRTAVIDGKLQRSSFSYDGLNRNLTMTYGAGTVEADTTTYQYDAANKTDRIDPIGARTHYDYDFRNRLEEVTYFDTGGSPVYDNINATRTCSYDDAGNLLGVVEPAKAGNKADVSYTYDALNRVKTETSGGQTHAYEYDLAGNRRKATYGGTNRVIVSTYDALNRLEMMTENGRVTTYRYDSSGNTVEKELPNGDLCAGTFDALNRKTSDTASNDGTALYQYDYKYDLNNNVRRIVEDYPASSGVAVGDRVVLNLYERNT